MAATITLSIPATCTECGAALPAGSSARYYSANHIYGIGCHASKPSARRGQPTSRTAARSSRRRLGAFIAAGRFGSEPLGQSLSRLDPHGLYTADGTRIGVSCGCEDYPCCGH
jgi:hypothetical protein